MGRRKRRIQGLIDTNKYMHITSIGKIHKATIGTISLVYPKIIVDLYSFLL